MLIDGPTVPAGATLRADVVVFGAGPAGITISEELAASNVRVLLVEAGGRTHSRFDDDALAGQSSGEPFPFVTSRHRGFGGTSTHWTPATGLRVRPFDELDFEARACRPNDSWPFGPSVLAPYYDRAHKVVGVEPGYDAARWFGSVDPSALTFRDGPNLAMFQFADHRCFVRRYDDVVASPHIQLVLQSSVRELELSDDGSVVSSASIVCPGGNRFSVTAPTFVLACGGIDNARILLSSRGRNGRGVGNEYDNVGRYFMDHLSVDTGVIVPKVEHSFDAEVFSENRSGSGHYQPMLWLGDDVIRRAGVANAAFWVAHVDPAYHSPGVSAARNLRAAMRSSPRRGLATHAVNAMKGSHGIVTYSTRKLLPRSRRRHIVGTRIMIEQVPNRESRVRLSEQRDSLGMRRVDLDWRVSAADLDVIVMHQELLGGLLETQGVATLVNRFDAATHRSPIMPNYHHIGTTRMHVNARHGVVDPDGRVHTTPNLYVAGSSVFPTGGYVNPTLTIVALALKTADAVRRQLQPFTARENAS